MVIQRKDFDLLRLVPYSLLFVLFAGTGFSQITWQRTYGGPDGSFGYSVQQTTDGGYIVTGHTYSFGNNSQVYLIKTDSLGDTLWTRTYGGSSEDRGMSVQQIADRGYIIAGYTNSFGNGYQIYLIKTDSLGDTIWTKTYGGAHDDYGYSVHQTIDGGYVITGGAFFSWDYDPVYLIKTDSFGNVVWAKAYGDTSNAIGRSVRQTADGGYIIAGTYPNQNPPHKIYLIKTDSLGDTLWSKLYGQSSLADGYSVRQTVDGGYIVAGSDFFRLYLVRTDSLGDTLWTKAYIMPAVLIGYSVQQTSDSGYIVTGYYGQGDSIKQVYLMKTDYLGDSLWTKTFGIIPYYSVGHSVQQTMDGGYIVCGYTYSPDSGWLVYLIKTDQDGNIARIEERNRVWHLSITAKLLVYPNPFKNAISIRFQIPSTKSQTSLKIYDAMGRLIRQWDYETMRQGDKIIWSGDDDSGRKLPPGVYFCRLETGETTVTQKVIKLE